MGTYLNRTAFEASYGLELEERLDPSGSGAFDPALLDAKEAAAEAIMDGFLAARYRLPLSYVPPMLGVIATRLTRAEVWDQATDLDQDNQVLKDKAWALATLKDIAQAKLNLDVDSDGQADGSGEVLVAGNEKSAFERALDSYK